MADNTVEIRIIADNSQLKAATQEGAASVERMGSSMEESAGKTEVFEKGIAHLGAHTIAHAAGLNIRMAMSLLRVGEAAAGLGPLLAVMIPVAAIVAGVEIMEKMEEAELKVKEAGAELAEQMGKLNDKLAEEKEKWTALVEGPMAAAAEKAKAFGDRQGEITPILKETNKALDEQVSKWASYVQWVQHASDVSVAFALHGPAGMIAEEAETVGMSNNELKSRIAIIEQVANQNKSYSAALRELNGIMKELANQPGPKTDQQMKVVADAAMKLGVAAQTAAQEQKTADEEAKKARQKNATDSTDIIKDETVRFKAQWDERINDAETAQKILAEITKRQVIEAEPTGKLSEDAIRKEQEAKLLANREDLTSFQDTLRLKAQAAEEEAKKEADVKRREAGKQISNISADSNEERAKKTKEINEKLASELLTISTNLEKQLNALRNDGLVKEQEAATKKLEIEKAAQKQRQELATETFKREADDRDKDLSLEENRVLKSTALQIGSLKELQRQRELAGNIRVFQSAGPEEAVYTRSIALISQLVEKQQEYVKALEEQKRAAEASGNLALAEAQDTEIDKTRSDLEKLTALLDEYKLKRQSINDDIVRSNQQALDKMTQGFNSGIQSWLTRSETFGKAMQQVWTNMALSAIQALLKITERMIAETIFHGIQLNVQTAQSTAANTMQTAQVVSAQTAQTAAVVGAQTAQVTAIAGAHAAEEAFAEGDNVIAEKGILGDAASAAADVFNKVIHALPFPANYILAPIAAAGVFTAIMGYKTLLGSAAQGAVVPTDMTMQLHAEEMVLPRRISVPLQNAIPAMETLHSVMNDNRNLDSGNKIYSTVSGGTTAGMLVGTGTSTGAVLSTGRISSTGPVLSSTEINSTDNRVAAMEGITSPTGIAATSPLGIGGLSPSVVAGLTSQGFSKESIVKSSDMLKEFNTSKFSETIKDKAFLDRGMSRDFGEKSEALRDMVSQSSDLTTKATSAQTDILKETLEKTKLPISRDSFVSPSGVVKSTELVREITAAKAPQFSDEARMASMLTASRINFSVPAPRPSVEAMASVMNSSSDNKSSSSTNITVNHSGQATSVDDIVNAVRKGIRKGTLAIPQ